MDTDTTNIDKKNIDKKNNQSQKHGFIFENSVREEVFKLSSKKNDTNIHDIPKEQNILNSNECCSIKTTGSKTICCGDILRFCHYDFNVQHTIIVISYIQNDTHKTIKRIYEINYNRKCHQKLFGNLPEEEIRKYVDGVKSIPANIKGKEAKMIYNYLVEKKKLNIQYNNIIQINPKVDSIQSRVQCSIPDFEKNLEEFITYKSSDEYPNVIRGKEIILSLESPRRKRKSKVNPQINNLLSSSINSCFDMDLGPTV